MKRFLVVFVTDGDYCTEVVFASDLVKALSEFELQGILYDTIHSITTLETQEEEATTTKEGKSAA